MQRRCISRRSRAAPIASQRADDETQKSSETTLTEQDVDHYDSLDDCCTYVDANFHICARVARRRVRVVRQAGIFLHFVTTHPVFGASVRCAIGRRSSFGAYRLTCNVLRAVARVLSASIDASTAVFALLRRIKLLCVRRRSCAHAVPWRSLLTAFRVIALIGDWFLSRFVAIF